MGNVEAMELELHNALQIPDDLELEHEIKRPRWWYAHQLRLAGADWGTCAQVIGYGDARAAQIAVTHGKQWAKISTEMANEAVQLDLERLDAMQLIAWKQVIEGNLGAMKLVLDIIGTRMKLLGTEKRPPEPMNVQNNAIFIGGTQEEYVDALKRAREAKVIDQ